MAQWRAKVSRPCCPNSIRRGQCLNINLLDMILEQYIKDPNSSFSKRYKNKIHEQGTLSVEDYLVYFIALKTLWEDRDCYDIEDWDCNNDHRTYLNKIQKMRVQKFLGGLNSEWESSSSNPQ